MMQRLACCVALALMACSGDKPAPEAHVQSPRVVGFVSDTVKDTAHGIWDTVEAPFEDVGILEDLIPEKLQQISTNPYAFPNPLRCDLLQKEIAELDGLLGPDVCTMANPTGDSTKDYLQQGVGMARDKATGYVGGKISLPFRGLVRRVSGADKHAKAVELAYQNGKLRRAFLKGVGMALLPGCLLAPLPSPPKP